MSSVRFRIYVLTQILFNFVLLFLVVFHFRMSRRMSTRVRRPLAVLMDSENDGQPPRRRRRMVEQGVEAAQSGMAVTTGINMPREIKYE